jgi:ADP-heptose:LPS heptosyltransferase
MTLGYRIDGGLGDVLIAAAALQDKGEACVLQTNPILEPVFRNNPLIKLGSTFRPTVFEWPSAHQRKTGINLWAIHTMQRFSVQIGKYTDPTDVLKIYGKDGIQRICKQKEKIICINQHSAEHLRRYIPDYFLNFIHMILPSDYKVVWVGANRNGQKSILDVEEMMDVLESCSLFIGPVSFCYHLASCLHVPSLLFTSYMPAHKFSHFFNTESISSQSPHQYKCEHNDGYKEESEFFEYDCREITLKLKRLLKEKE